MGKNGDVFPEGAAPPDQGRGETPPRNALPLGRKKRSTALRSASCSIRRATCRSGGDIQGRSRRRLEDLDIPAGADNVRTDGYTRLTKAARHRFQPHMHNRGKMQCVEAIYPNRQTEMLSCARFNFGWRMVYNYADDAAPLVPAGTMLHIIGVHDNSAGQQREPRSDELGRLRPADGRRDGFAWMNCTLAQRRGFRQQVADEESIARRSVVTTAQR